mmetsp:Transcript_28986/g.33098  ORF Transcript_28986/g.33098 Transcript_28986/m.33098 type:complete len:205 (-) Transcript_28986:227-841(-)
MVFLLNLRDGLLKYQKYYQSLLDEKAKLLEKVDKKFAIKLMEGEESKDYIEQEKQQRIQEIDHKFEEVISMLVQSYSAHIGSAIPEPGSLPVRVKIVLITKKIEFKDISMKPFDTMNDIKRIVEDRLEERQNPVESWEDDVEVYVRGPLAILKTEEVKDEWDIDEGMNADKVLGKTIKVENMLTTREKLGIENGSTIEFYGTIK